MLPLPFGSITRSSCFMLRSVPRTLVSKVVGLCGLLRDRAGLAFGTGVVDGHIEAAKARDGLIDQVAHIVVVAHVGTPILRLNADLAEFGDQFLAGFVAAAGDNDARAFTRESNRGG